ncbi:putative FAD-dependent oxygenase [Aspergillus lucknowensis]|uniref:FAD-binding PCMH-type domain-containing protein n=1 Tax=Aspergillus lucknowensis TaxID=176173 RepID=A0ABR4LKA0_9EURO
MFRLRLEALVAVAALISASCADVLTRGLCSRDDPDVQALGSALSPTAEIYFPGSDEFEAATTRWSVLETPTVNVVVVPGTENDVVATVKYANKKRLPFLVYNGVHGAITTLGRMDSGVGISLGKLSSVKIAGDGNTATIGGGTFSKTVTDTLWAAGKQTVTGTCECVSYLGPALGGGHGWLQGHHGLVADQLVSARIVLADGTLKTIDANSDLWWAIGGAGHNFGIVTSVTTKIFDIEHRDWAIETLIFSGDKLEAVYQAANDLLADGTQSADLINWSYWLNIPDFDPDHPVIMFYIIQQGVTAVDPTYTSPFHAIGPLSIQPQAGTYTDLAGWTGIANTSPPCQNAGLVNPRFPIYLYEYNVAALRTAYDTYAEAIGGSSVFNASLFMFEGYPTEGVRAQGLESSAFAFRDRRLLAAPLITYSPLDAERDAEAARVGNQLRQILHDASGLQEFGVYVNYAYGDETPEQWYGSEEWRQDRLQGLKAKYDPSGKFSFFGPVA